MHLAEEVDVGGPLPLPRPLVLFQHSPKHHLSLITLLRNMELEGRRGEGRRREEGKKEVRVRIYNLKFPPPGPITLPSSYSQET